MTPDSLSGWALWFADIWGRNGEGAGGSLLCLPSQAQPTSDRPGGPPSCLPVPDQGRPGLSSRGDARLWEAGEGTDLKLAGNAELLKERGSVTR